MFEFYSLPPTSLGRFLERQKAGLTLRPEIDLDVLLKQILQKAYEFVPSASGSILLDDPISKTPNRVDNELVFIATFGEGSEVLLGNRLSAAHGIAGRVYQTGASYLSENVENDMFFYRDIDAKLGHKTNSIVCVPIYIGKNVCGVLELINRSDGRAFTTRDMTLLEIFAGYTSFTLQNALDAKRAHELAKRDDLTGLYNDRWFHVRLAEALADADATGKDCVLLFMDLDNFKVINDTHGHLAGSQVLREVGFLLKRVIEKEHATVSRYGGDEFVMVLPNTSLQEGIRFSAEIRSLIEETSFIDHEYGFGMPALHVKGVLSASIGIALYTARPEGGGSIDARKNELLRRADSAMYEAKSGGKGKIVVSHAEPERKQRFEVVAHRARAAANDL